VSGLYSAVKLNAGGYGAYLLGEYGRGWWYYFPVALALKTTLPMLALVALGAVLMRSLDRERRHEAGFFVITAAAYLGLTMVTSLNIGVRHLLPMTPFLAAIAAIPLAGGLRLGGGVTRAATVAGALLVVAHVADSSASHPDAIAYFNQIVPRGREDEYLLDSNLDWGQDIDRLSRAAARRGIDSLGVVCLTNADLARHGLRARAHDWTRRDAASGWLAVSAHMLKGVTEIPHDKYRWLEEIEPVERVGRSIRLYRFPEPGERSPEPGAER
jgi:hypothetical protein